MSPSELSTICLNRWLSSDPIRWRMKSLNGSQSHTYCLYLNGFRGDPPSLKCFVNGSKKPNKFLIAVNVGRSSKGDTFIGSDLQRGCHWTMWLVDINSRERSFMVTHWDGLFLMGSLTRFTHSSGWLAVLKRIHFQWFFLIFIKQACREGEVQRVRLHPPGVVEVCPFGKKKK